MWSAGAEARLVHPRGDRTLSLTLCTVAEGTALALAASARATQAESDRIAEPGAERRLRVRGWGKEGGLAGTTRFYLYLYDSRRISTRPEAPKSKRETHTRSCAESSVTVPHIIMIIFTDGNPNGEQGEGSCVKIVANGHVDVDCRALMARSVASLPDPWEELALPREPWRLKGEKWRAHAVGRPHHSHWRRHHGCSQ